MKHLTSVLSPRTNMLLVVLAAGLMLVPDLAAQRLGVNIRVGTRGPGIGLSYGLLEQLNVRATARAFTYSRNDTFTETVDGEDINLGVESEARLAGFSILFDYFPFKNGLRLSGGAFYSAFKTEVFARPLNSYKFDDNKTFSAQKMGSLFGVLEYENKIQPYIGLGLGNPVGQKKVQFLLDIGAIYAGSPQMDLTGTGLIAPTANQEDILNQGIESFQLWPLVSVGVSYRIL